MTELQPSCCCWGDARSNKSVVILHYCLVARSCWNAGLCVYVCVFTDSCVSPVHLSVCVGVWVRVCVFAKVHTVFGWKVECLTSYLLSISRYHIRSFTVTLECDYWTQMERQHSFCKLLWLTFIVFRLYSVVSHAMEYALKLSKPSIVTFNLKAVLEQRVLNRVQCRVHTHTHTHTQTHVLFSCLLYCQVQWVVYRGSHLCSLRMFLIN